MDDWSDVTNHRPAYHLPFFPTRLLSSSSREGTNRISFRLQTFSTSHQKKIGIAKWNSSNETKSNNKQMKGKLNRFSQKRKSRTSLVYLLLAQDPVLAGCRGWRNWDKCCCCSPSPAVTSAPPPATPADVDPPKQWLCPVTRKHLTTVTESTVRNLATSLKQQTKDPHNRTACWSVLYWRATTSDEG